MASAVSNRIREWRQRRGLSMAGLAARVGTSAPQINRLEKGQRRLDLGWMDQLAAALGCRPRDLLSGVDIDDPESPEPAVDRITVLGAVEAGTWRHGEPWPPEEHYQIAMPAHPRHPRAAKIGLLVRGRSMDLVYPPGTIVICAAPGDLGRRPRSGDRVVVRACQPNGLIEATVKELQLADDGAAWLWPRSTQPEHQTPLRLPRLWRDHGADTTAGTDDGDQQTAIVAIVIASYRVE